MESGHKAFVILFGIFFSMFGIISISNSFVSTSANNVILEMVKQNKSIEEIERIKEYLK